MIILLVGLIVQFQLTIALAAAAYALSGPVLAISDRMHRGKHLPVNPRTDIAETTPTLPPAIMGIPKDTQDKAVG